jgi:hypothetical protein
MRLGHAATASWLSQCAKAPDNRTRMPIETIKSLQEGMAATPFLRRPPGQAVNERKEHEERLLDRGIYSREASAGIAVPYVVLPWRESPLFQFPLHWQWQEIKLDLFERFVPIAIRYTCILF